MWLLSVVVKQDLWWPERQAVEECYRHGPYHLAVQAVLEQAGATIRHELHPMSLVINNLKTSGGETIQENAKGYDQHLQIDSVRRLFEIVDSLRRWEEER